MDGGRAVLSQTIISKLVTVNSQLRPLRLRNAAGGGDTFTSVSTVKLYSFTDIYSFFFFFPFKNDCQFSYGWFYYRMGACRSRLNWPSISVIPPRFYFRVSPGDVYSTSYSRTGSAGWAGDDGSADPYLCFRYVCGG